MSDSHHSTPNDVPQSFKYIILEVFFAVEADGVVEFALKGVKKLVGENDVVWLANVEIVIFGHMMEKPGSIAY